MSFGEGTHPKKQQAHALLIYDKGGRHPLQKTSVSLTQQATNMKQPIPSEPKGL